MCCKSCGYLLLNLVQHLSDVVHSCCRLLPLLLLHCLVLPLLLRLHAHHHCRRHSRRQDHLARNGDEHCVNSIVQPFEIWGETSSIRCKICKFFLQLRISEPLSGIFQSRPGLQLITADRMSLLSLPSSNGWKTSSTLIRYIRITINFLSTLYAFR
jgi:hypothetical protein